MRIQTASFIFFVGENRGNASKFYVITHEVLKEILADWKDFERENRDIRRPVNN